MRKATKGFIASVLALTMLAPMAACSNGSGGNGNATLIRVSNYGGGIGRAWLDEAIVRFKEQVKDVSYENGKSGVEFAVTHNINVSFDDMKGSGEHLYFTVGDVRTLIQQGLFMDIDDIVKEVVDTRDGTEITIEDKLPEDSRYKFQGTDGKYYCLPYYEYYDGLSYDADTFDKYGLYLADPAAGGEAYDCTITGETVYFVSNTDARKACGNDGVYGTYDDGMPTSLYEMVALCDYMKTQKSVTPFTVAGNHLIRYSNKMLIGMWAALSGADTSVAFSFDGNVDYVTGFSDTEKLFPGEATIMAPTLEENAPVTKATGYKAINQAGRYYAAAFMELAHKQGWFDTRSNQTSHTHKEAMRALVLSGVGGNTEVGMLIEGTYWYPEAEGYGLFEEYAKTAGTQEAKNVKYFNMPTSLKETVTEDNGRKEALASAGGAYSVINGNLAGKADKEGIVKACKDFIKFLYTDAELQNFTKTTGARKGEMDYDVSPILDELPPFKQSLMAVGNANADVIVRQSSNNELFRNNSGLLTWGDSRGWTPELDGIGKYNNFLKAFRAGATAQDCFKSTGYTEGTWKETFSQYIN